MKYKRMNAKMFADYLFNMKDNTSVVFATKSELPMEIGGATENDDKLACFYYARNVYDEQFDSQYIVIDYLSGGEAHVIALDFNKEDDENFEHILESVQHFMSFWFFDVYLEVEE